MKSSTDLQNLFGTLTNDSSATNLAVGLELMNDSIRKTCAARDWDFMQTQFTDQTVASQQAYNLPYDYDSLENVNFLVGTTTYVPSEAPNKDFWDLLNQNTTITSNIQNWYFIINKTILYYPTPSQSSNSINYTYRRRVVDLSRADYTTGNVSAVTNNTYAVTGSGTTWTAAMAGRYIRINATDVATTDGDEFWYQIASVQSATALTLTRPYAGTTISANSTYTIGQMSALPEAYQDIPVYEAAMTYFSTIQPEKDRFDLMAEIYEAKYAQLVYDHSTKTMNPAIDDDHVQTNPNLFVTL